MVLVIVIRQRPTDLAVSFDGHLKYTFPAAATS